MDGALFWSQSLFTLPPPPGTTPWRQRQCQVPHFSFPFSPFKEWVPRDKLHHTLRGSRLPFQVSPQPERVSSVLGLKGPPTLSSIDGEFKIGQVIGARLPFTDFDLGPRHL